MVKLKPEQKLIFLQCGANPPDRILEDINRLIENSENPVDYDRTLELAGSNEVLTFLYINLKDNDTIPDGTKSKLRNAYLYALRNNVLQAEEMMKLLTLLKKYGIEAIPLKGAIASDMIFGDPGLYLSTDIDILVRPSDIPSVDKVLRESGYKTNEGISKDDLLSSHYHLLFQKDRHHVEVHWNLIKRYFKIPAEFWWEDVQKTVYQWIEITLLSVEKYIMYLVFRLFDHGFKPLKFFVLIAEMINKHHSEIDWQAIFKFANQYKMKRLVIVTFKLLSDLLGTNIPDEVISRKVAGYENFKKVVVSGLFNEVERPHLRMIFYMFLLDTLSDFIKILARRIFPSSGEIRLRYGLSKGSKKVYAYYVLNPVLMVWKKRRVIKYE